MSFLYALPMYILIGVVFITMLMVLVAAHEFGHYLFARLFGMACEEFAIGMGGKKPWIIGKREYIVPVGPNEDPEAKGEINAMEGGAARVEPVIVERPDGIILKETTLFTIRPLPVGGFVRIKGMMPEEDGSEIRIPGGFFSKAPWKRWIVLAAGPAFSVIAGILLLIPVLTIYGMEEPTDKPIIGGVMVGSAAQKGGLKAKDLVRRIDGKEVTTWATFTQEIRGKGTNPIRLEIERKGQPLTLTVTGKLSDEPMPIFDQKGELTGEKRRVTQVGIEPSFERKKVSLKEAFVTAVSFPVRSTAFLIERFSNPKELKKNVGGPGTMITATSQSIEEGPWAVVRLAGLLSISVGIFNLLPFPPLDGGQMWIAVVEMFRGGRRLSINTQMTVLKIGFAMVFALIATVLFIDFQRVTGIDPLPTFDRGTK